MHRDLYVFHDNNTVFTDYSRQAKTYLKDSFLTPLVALEDYLYVGLHKNFFRLFIGFTVANTVANTLAIEYYNGAAWVAVSRFEDETVGGTRAGFITWENDTDDWAEVEVNGETKKFIRIKPSADWLATTSISGLSLILANDDDMREKYLNIGQFLDSDEASFINFHQAARNEIVQDMRNSGKIISSDGVNYDLTVWDLHRPQQLREAAAYKALAILFFEASNATDDKAYQIYQSFEAKYSKAFSTYLLSYDSNDNGKEEIAESNTAIRNITIRRV